MNEEIEQTKDEFKSIFGQNDFYKKLRNAVLSGTFHPYYIRSIAWKLFLGLLSSDSTDTWIDEASKWRNSYSKLKNELVINPVDSNDDDLLTNNPLATDNKGRWSQFWKDSRFSETIMLDVERTRSDDTFFQQEKIQKQMLSVLFIWSKLNPTASYKQGMNELLAPIILLLNSDALNLVGADLPSIMLDKRYIEADAFALFEKMMEKLAVEFIPNEENPQQSHILKRCNKLHHFHLAGADQELYHHLERVGVMPQYLFSMKITLFRLYALRWIRCLFSREFPHARVLILWDAVFAEGGNEFGLVDFVGTAILLYVKNDLMVGDECGCLNRLLRLPPIGDMNMLVGRALALKMGKKYSLPQNPSLHMYKQTKSNAAPFEDSNPVSSFTSKLSKKIDEYFKSDFQEHTVVTKFPNYSPKKTYSVNQETSLRDNSAIHAHPNQTDTSQRSILIDCGHRLEYMLILLEDRVRLGSQVTTEQENNAFHAVAELKQLKEFMLGHIEISDLLPLPQNTKIKTNEDGYLIERSEPVNLSDDKTHHPVINSKSDDIGKPLEKKQLDIKPKSKSNPLLSLIGEEKTKMTTVSLWDDAIDRKNDAIDFADSLFGN